MAPILLDLSIVIVNYKTRKLLLGCLASIYSNQVSNSISFECIVIDNASNDGSSEAVSATYPQVRLITNTENHYFSAAYTQGINEAVGRYVLVLNPDMIIEGHTLTQLVRQMDSDPSIGAATTTMHFPTGELQRNGSRFVNFGYLLFQYTFLGKLMPGRLRAYRDWLWYADWDRTTRRDIDVLPGSCIIATRETWLAAGGFNDAMPMYFSDDYLSWSVQKLGKRTVYLVSDGIVHFEGASTQHATRRTLTARSLQLYFHDLLVYTRLRFGPLAQAFLAVMLIPTRIVQHFNARE